MGLARLEEAVKLAHAIGIVEKLSDVSGPPAGDYWTSEERAAMRVLVAMGKRVLATRPSLRAVVRAVYGEDLNQVELDDLFKEDERGSGS
jgi:hypothetical protein